MTYEDRTEYTLSVKHVEKTMRRNASEEENLQGIMFGRRIGTL